MRARVTALVALVLAALTTTAFAEKLKVAIPQKGFWDSEFVEFAQKRGMFEKAGLEIEIFWTHGGSETLNAAISGSPTLPCRTERWASSAPISKARPSASSARK